MVENGATPSWTPDQAREFGFKIIIFPFLTIAPAYEAIKSSLQHFKKTGTSGISKDFTPKKLFTVVGLEKATAVDAEAGGSMYSRV
ncbi:hypothetical protein ACCO45_009723 [Purpureocillium lilacinum]